MGESFRIRSVKLASKLKRILNILAVFHFFVKTLETHIDKCAALLKVQTAEQETGAREHEIICMFFALLKPC